MIPIVPIPTNYTTPCFGCCSTEFSKFFTQLHKETHDSDSQKKTIGACATKDYFGPCDQCCVSSTSDAINYS